MEYAVSLKNQNKMLALYLVSAKDISNTASYLDLEVQVITIVCLQSVFLSVFTYLCDCSLVFCFLRLGDQKGTKGTEPGSLKLQGVINGAIVFTPQQQGGAFDFRTFSVSLAGKLWVYRGAGPLGVLQNLGGY